MASITLKDIPVDLHAQLKQEAGANYRSLNQELLARIQRSFDLDERLTAGQVNRLIQEAVDAVSDRKISSSWPELPLCLRSSSRVPTAISFPPWMMPMRSAISSAMLN
jgi:hypothetical protein